VVADAQAGPPTDGLKVGIDRVVQVLADPSLKGAANAKARRETLLKITGPIFDWTEMARRPRAALAPAHGHGARGVRSKA